MKKITLKWPWLEANRKIGSRCKKVADFLSQEKAMNFHSKFGRAFFTAWACGCLSALPLIARGDVALVIGVNHYANLPADSQLDGCVDDARSMAAVLSDKFHFAVTVKLNSEATKANIEQALKIIKASIKPGERLVIFFAGHGTRANREGSAILPFDAGTGSDISHDISSGELFELVSAIDCYSRTIILDSCFSGGMIKDLNDPQVKERYYRRPWDDHSKSLVDTPDGKDDGSVFEGGSKVCYLSGCSGSEYSREAKVGGEQAHGIFTSVLVEALNNAPVNANWGDVVTAVGGKVSQITEGQQHPAVSTLFRQDALFGAVQDVAQGGSVASPSGAGPITGQKARPGTTNTTVDPNAYVSSTAWDLYSRTGDSAATIELKLSPYKSEVAVGDPLQIKVQVKRNGYVVLVEKTTTGEVRLIWPHDASGVSSEVVDTPQTLSLPSRDGTFQFDSIGVEQIEAVFFDTKNEANWFLTHFHGVYFDPVTVGPWSGPSTAIVARLKVQVVDH